MTHGRPLSDEEQVARAIMGDPVTWTEKHSEGWRRAALRFAAYRACGATPGESWTDIRKLIQEEFTEHGDCDYVAGIVAFQGAIDIRVAAGEDCHKAAEDVNKTWFALLEARETEPGGFKYTGVTS